MPMKHAFSLAVWMTLASVVAKLILFKLDLDLQKNAMYSAFFNLLVISVGTFFAVRQFKIRAARPTKFQEDVKAGMRTAALYALLMTIFVFVYYSYIDAGFFTKMIESRLAAARIAVEQGQEIDLEKTREFGEFIFSPKTHSTITLFGFLVAGAIYSLLITVFMRKFPGFK